MMIVLLIGKGTYVCLGVLWREGFEGREGQGEWALVGERSTGFRWAEKRVQGKAFRVSVLG